MSDADRNPGEGGDCKGEPGVVVDMRVHDVVAIPAEGTPKIPTEPRRIGEARTRDNPGAEGFRLGIVTAWRGRFDEKVHLKPLSVDAAEHFDEPGLRAGTA